MRGVMLTQQDLGLCRHTLSHQECMWHTVPSRAAMELCGVQPAAGSMATPHRQPQLFRILQCFRRNTCPPHRPIPHSHNHTGCGTQLPGERLLLRSPSPHVTLLGLPTCQGVPQGPHSLAWCFSSSNCRLEKSNQEKFSAFKLAGEARCTSCRG